MSGSFLLNWFRPLYDALFAPSLPFDLRWRLLTLQPLAFLTYTIKYLPWIFSPAYTVLRIPTRRPNDPLRALVFQPPQKQKQKSGNDDKLRPLHLDMHGGSFMGGIAEYDAPFCALLARSTGAVVISTQYRYCPRHHFPAAHEDIEDVSLYLVQNAERLWGANPKLLTVSGFSAGSNLALTVSQMGGGLFQWPSETAVKGCVTFYAPVDLRLPPAQKPRPPNYPTKDPLFFLGPLIDSYTSPVRAATITDPRLHPTLADLNALPLNMLLIVPTIDILLDEQLRFAERVGGDIERYSASGERGPKRSLQIEIFEKCLHGWLECE
jgi:acetyl esterase/lipase